MKRRTDAAAAGWSRASLKRMFPGKPAPLGDVIRVFSPLDTMAETVERIRDPPPHEVMPEIARAAARALAERVGIVRTRRWSSWGCSTSCFAAGVLGGSLARQLANSPGVDATDGHGNRWRVA
jgi:hypothetical protein